MTTLARRIAHALSLTTLGLGLAGTGTAFAEMRVTLLGTGTPVPERDSAGPATLVQIGEQILLFDAGRDVVRGLLRAGVGPGDVDALFVTHMHSDHVTGIPDLLLTGWLTIPGGNRQSALPIHGGPGVAELARGLAVAYASDIRIRLDTVPVAPGGEQLEARVFDEDGIIFEKDGVTVTAFTVPHGEKVAPAYGYRVDHEKVSVTISGDTTVSEQLVSSADGTDLLIHEVFAANDTVSATPVGKAVASIHVTPEEAGEVFSRVKPTLAVFTHVVLLPPEPPSRADVLARTKAVYDGPVEMGADGMSFIITENGVEVVRP